GVSVRVTVSGLYWKATVRSTVLPSVSIRMKPPLRVLGEPGNVVMGTSDLEAVFDFRAPASLGLLGLAAAHEVLDDLERIDVLGLDLDLRNARPGDLAVLSVGDFSERQLELGADLLLEASDFVGPSVREQVPHRIDLRRQVDIDIRAHLAGGVRVGGEG